MLCKLSNSSKCFVLLVIVGCVALSAFRQKTPKVLIIGDSISIGYTPFVANRFAGKVEILHNAGNAQHTGTGLQKITAWVGDTDWDIIQINWGLWDLCYRSPKDSTRKDDRDKVSGKLTTAVQDYAANLDTIIATLRRQTKARLIFATTTYVPPNEPGRFQADVIKYNDAAKVVMKKHGVAINDLYVESISIHQANGLGNDDVHYNTEGYKKLGELVSRFLENETSNLKEQ